MKCVILGKFSEKKAQFGIKIQVFRSMRHNGALLKMQMEVSMQYYDKKDVGERIKVLRKRKHLTQSELSECLDYTNERQLQRIESGETACSVDKLMEVAQILETSTDFLLFGIEKETIIDFSEYVKGKSRGEKLFVQRVVETVVSNVNLLYLEEA